MHTLLQQAIEAGAEIPAEELPNYHLEYADLQLTMGNREGAQATLNSGTFQDGSRGQALAGLLQFKLDYTSGDIDKCQETLESVREVVESLGELEIELKYLTNNFALVFGQGKFEEAISSTNRELELAKNSGSQFELARCLSNRGTAHMRLASNLEDSESQLDKSSECKLQAASIFKELGRVDLELNANVGFAVVEFLKGNLDLSLIHI